MNIKTRLQKLESEVITEQSELCACPFTRFLMPGIIAGDAEIAAETDCRTCGKPKGKVREFTFRFNSNAPIAEEGL